MTNENIWSLRLGFSTEQANDIMKNGFENFLKKSFEKNNDVRLPDFLIDTPKSLRELNELKKQFEKQDPNSENLVKKFVKIGFQFKAWWLDRIYDADFPLHEKMNLFWHNHFVSTYKSVKVPFWIYQHYEIINKNAFGNYKQLVKEIVYSNAMIKYLDNNENKSGRINENLGRELLELFTLGEGNYTENDIKNTALALAGLTFGEDKAQYRPFIADNSLKTVFGKTGNFKIDEVIDIIFEQKNVPYFIARKILKWFVYDDPIESLVIEYGNVLKSMNYEIKPFLEHIFSKEFEKKTAGTQIKNPLVFSIQILKELHLKPNLFFLTLFLKNQGMDIYDQTNVKGWAGGKTWLTSQIYINRNQFSDFLTIGNQSYQKILNRQVDKFDLGELNLNPKIVFSKTNAKNIIAELSDELLFETSLDLQNDMNQILKYDFDPNEPNAEKAVLRLMNYIFKTPEFQII